MFNVRKGLEFVFGEISMRLRIATYNLENLDEMTDARRAGALRQDMLRLDADVLCLQEINAQGTKSDRSLAVLDALLSGTPYASYERAVTHSQNAARLRDTHNLVILSRLPILEKTLILHDFVKPYNVISPSGISHEIRFDRPMLYAQLQMRNGAALHVLNLHWRAPLPAFVPEGKDGPWRWRSTQAFAEGCWIALQKQAAQAYEARLFIDSIFNHNSDALILVAGDFNASGHELATRTVRADYADTGNPDLTARALRAVEASLPRKRRFSLIHGGERLMFDHILMSRSLQAQFIDADLYNGALPDELAAYYTGHAPRASFHAPLAASFVWPEEKKPRHNNANIKYVP